MKDYGRKKVNCQPLSLFGIIVYLLTFSGSYAGMFLNPANEVVEANSEKGVRFVCGGLFNASHFSFNLYQGGNQPLIGRCDYISPGVTRCDHNKKFRIIHVEKPYQFDLEITKPTFMDAGEYTCHNEVESRTGVLVVVDPPYCGIKSRTGNKAKVFCGDKYGSFIPVDVKLTLGGTRTQQTGIVSKSVNGVLIEREFDVQINTAKKVEYICRVHIDWFPYQEDLSEYRRRQYLKKCTVTV